jgi:hypothetical protein
MPKLFAAVLAILFLAAGADARQSRKAGQNVASAKGPARKADVTQSGTPRPVEPSSGEGRRWAFYVTATSLSDSNINHDEEGLRSFGLVGGAGVYFRNRPERPTFEFTYEVGRHAYTRTDRWDRTSHALRVNSERALGLRLVSETTGEVSFKGTTEDRELTNRFGLKQKFQFRLTRADRFNLAAAYRLKRYTEGDRGRDSVNPYVEGGYERRLGGGRRVEVSYRYETNRSRNERFRYLRRTYGLEFTTPLTRRGVLRAEARYRPQKYARLVEVELPGGEEVDLPRLDRRWIFSADWRRGLGRGLELDLLYKYERRVSNDPDRNFTARAAGVGLTYRFWR